MGFDPAFLGIAVPLPSVTEAAGPLVTLDYTHFSVILNRRRRIAALTAVNIDGPRLLDLPRGDDWHLDDRVPASEQIGPDVYAGNALDRGHLVRRRDPVWGEDAAQANADTFSYTNAAPQVNVFNQSKDLWLGLEDYVLQYAETTDQRIDVFTGPVLDDSDLVYRDVQLPRAFWKVAAWVDDGELACTAYLLDQGALLDGLLLPTISDLDSLGPYLTYQVAVTEVARLTGIGLDQLAAADRFRARSGLRETDWIPLREYGDITL
jgi:endonuclease G